MKHHHTLSIHYALRAVILIGFTLFILRLVQSDAMLYYIAPRMELYVKLSALGLYAMAVYQGFLAVMALLGKIDSCDCHHPPSRSLVRNTVIYGLFVLPLALGFLMPNQLLGSSIAAKKGMQYKSSAALDARTPPTVKEESPLRLDGIAPLPLPSEPKASPSSVPGDPGIPDPENQAEPEDAAPHNAQSLDDMFASDDPFTEMYAKHAKTIYKQDMLQVPVHIYMETLTTIDLYLDHFVGKQIQLSGFVYREETMDNHQFVVARFAMQCCSADAAPYGVLVEYDQAGKLIEDEWVQVTGTLDKTVFRGNEIMTIKVEQTEHIPTPAEPYVYPNYEFGYD